MVQNVPLKLLEIQGKANKSAKGADGFSSLQNQANQTAQLDWNISKEMPSEYDGDIQWAQMAKQNMADLKKKSPWETAFNSIFSGIEQNAQSGKNKKIMENANKIKGVLSYFSDMNEKLAERRQQYEIRDMAIIQIVRSINEYLTHAHNISPQDKMNFVRSKLKEWNQFVGDDLELEGLDGFEPSKIFVSSKSKGLSSINLTDIFSEFKQKQDANTLEQMAKEEADRLRAIEERRLNIDQQRANSYEKHADFDTDPVQRGMRAGLEQRAKDNSEYVNKLQQKLFLTDTGLKDLKEMSKIINDSYIAGKTPWAALGRFLAPSVGQTYSEDKVKMLTRNRLMGAREALGGILSDQDINLWLSTDPSLKADRQASLERINDLLTQEKNKANLYRKQIKTYEKNPTANLFGSTSNISIPNAVSHEQGTDAVDRTKRKNQTNAGAGNGSGISIILTDPETGEETTEIVTDINQAIAKAKKIGLDILINAK